MSRQPLSSLGAVGAALRVRAPIAFGQALDEVSDGKVRMSFAAGPGVCGDGDSSISMNGGRGWYVRHRDSDNRKSDCERGPVGRVLTLRDGEVTKVRTCVGGSWRSPSSTTVDLGTVSAPEAADYLVSFAGRSEGRAAEAAILPAMLADSATVWPELLTKR